MRRVLPYLAALTVVACSATAQDDPHMAAARRVLAATPLIDGHNDLPWAVRENTGAPGDLDRYDISGATPGHTDLARLAEGMVGGQFWSVYVRAALPDSNWAHVQLEQIDIARRIIERYDRLEWALTADALEDAFARGKIGSMLGLEGGHVIENSLALLRLYYDLGARYMTLTHSNTNDWADSGTDDERHGGLTDFGREVVREMNRLGMLVDLSHTSDGTMSDALEVTEAPVIFSHSSARALADHPRNVPDSILRRLPGNGGVVMVTFVPDYLREDGNATVADVVDHIEHVRDVAGVNHVGIGADYDGIDHGPTGLDDVSDYPKVFAELSRRGWTEEEMALVAGGNVLRVLRQAEATASQLQQERGPSAMKFGE